MGAAIVQGYVLEHVICRASDLLERRSAPEGKSLAKELLRSAVSLSGWLLRDRSGVDGARVDGCAKRTFPESLRLDVEGDECASFDVTAGAEQRSHRDLACLQQGESEGTGGQRGEGHADGTHVVAQPQARQIRRRQQPGSGFVDALARTHRVDDVLHRCGEPERGRDHCRTGWAGRERAEGSEQVGARGAVNRAIHPAAAGEGTVGRCDQDLGVHRGDVAAHDLDPHARHLVELSEPTGISAATSG